MLWHCPERGFFGIFIRVFCAQTAIGDQTVSIACMPTQQERTLLVTRAGAPNGTSQPKGGSMCNSGQGCSASSGILMWEVREAIILTTYIPIAKDNQGAKVNPSSHTMFFVLSIFQI